MSESIGALISDFEKALSGPALGSAMKILTPQQMAAAISMVSARKRGDMATVERVGREFLGTLTEGQIASLRGVLGEGLVGRILALKK